MISPTHYLLVSALLFCIGLAGIMTRRNIILILLSIELMFNAANLAFVTFAKSHGDPSGQVIVFFIITVRSEEHTSELQSQR